MARETGASKRNAEIVQKVARLVISERKCAMDDPELAFLVVARLRMEHRSAFEYMERYCGGAHNETRSIIGRMAG